MALRRDLSRECSCISVYYDKTTDDYSKELGNLIERLETYQLIDATALSDAWPEYRWRGIDLHGPSDKVNEQEPHRYCPPDRISEILPLRHSATDTLVDLAVTQPEGDIARVSEALVIPGVRETLKRKLYAMAEADELNPSSTILELICAALKDDVFVDLSPFRSLTSSSLYMIISRLHQHGNMTELKLSNNPSITESDLCAVVAAKPILHTLYLLGKSQISLGLISSLSQDFASAPRRIYHTQLFRRPFQCRPQHLHTLDVNAKQAKFIRNLVRSQRFAQSNQVVGAIWVSMEGEVIVRKSNKNGKAAVDWKKIGENPERQVEEFPGIPETLQVKYDIFPLHDTILPHAQLANGPINFCKYVTGECGRSRYDSSWVGVTFAKSFAKASSAIPGVEEEVRPLPSALYSDSSLAAVVSGSPWPLDMPDIVPGRWTIIIVHEYLQCVLVGTDSSAKTRCALISRKEETRSSSP